MTAPGTGDDLAQLAADLNHAAQAMPSRAEVSVRAVARGLEMRARVAGDLSAGVTASFPTSHSAVVGSTKRFGVYQEVGTGPVPLDEADAERSADDLAARLLAQATGLLERA